ncbi:TatD family hydrolase [Paenibacillus sp. GCM10023252]|uniref:TatD family hydrolase n=1 Tax=Paenibacillus sp. GCM10023252 TaxID=3252649 RepID=UPI0036198114
MSLPARDAILPWMDAHIHLDLYDEAERAPLLEQAFADGGEAVVAVSMNLESSRVNYELARSFPGRVLPAYGFHPEQPVPTEQQMSDLVEWIRERHEAGESFAIGEVGLPYYTRMAAQSEATPFDEEPYLQLLDTFIALAAELRRPIVLHAVYEDADKACDMLEQYGVKRAHFHWFKGSMATIQRMIALGCFISITPDVSYESEIQELVRAYPLELMMAETDGPWPFEREYEGLATKPSMVLDVIHHIAQLKGISVETASAALLNNARRMYESPLI